VLHGRTPTRLNWFREGNNKNDPLKGCSKGRYTIGTGWCYVGYTVIYQLYRQAKRAKVNKGESTTKEQVKV